MLYSQFTKLCLQLFGGLCEHCGRYRSDEITPSIMVDISPLNPVVMLRIIWVCLKTKGWKSKGSFQLLLLPSRPPNIMLNLRQRKLQVPRGVGERQCNCCCGYALLSVCFAREKASQVQIRPRLLSTMVDHKPLSLIEKCSTYPSRLLICQVCHFSLVSLNVKWLLTVPSQPKTITEY